MGDPISETDDDIHITVCHRPHSLNHLSKNATETNSSFAIYYNYKFYKIKCYIGETNAMWYLSIVRVRGREREKGVYLIAA